MDALQLTNLETGVIVTANTPAANISLVRSEVGFTSLASTMWSGGKHSPASSFSQSAMPECVQRRSSLFRGADSPVANTCGKQATAQSSRRQDCSQKTISFTISAGGRTHSEEHNCSLTTLREIVFQLVVTTILRSRYTYQAGAHVAGAGVVLRKNLFYSSHHVAILFGGNDHLFELNEIRNVATIGYDTGAIYGGRDLSSRGTTIRYNLFHHLDNPAPCNPETSCIRQVRTTRF